MGTTLTGTTPQDTYDSLIKVTDNGPLTGSLKVLTDGLGNNSALALSTGAASVTGTLAVTAGTNLATASGNVGIGTSAPAQKLHIGGVGSALAFDTTNAAASSTIQTVSDFVLSIKNIRGTGSEIKIGNESLQFFTSDTERVRILAAGGLTFNGDTAAANALDDYEEGTWTMGVSFDGASVAVTTSANTGTYTKIGRQVTVNGYLVLTSKGSSTGAAKITGLPFTISTGDAFYSAVTLHQENISFANQFQGYGLPNSTTINLRETTDAGANTAITDADFANNSGILLSLTYFV